MINPYVGICFLLFVVLLLMEVPIPFGMIASSILYSVLNGESLVLLPSKIATSYSDWSMLAVPAFLFVGTFMNEMGLTDRIFGFAEAWLGRVTGGLAHANVLASMLFADTTKTFPLRSPLRLQRSGRSSRPASTW